MRKKRRREFCRKEKDFDKEQGKFREAMTVQRLENDGKTELKG
jgi:hypothetical protein